MAEEKTVLTAEEIAQWRTRANWHKGRSPLEISPTLFLVLLNAADALPKVEVKLGYALRMAEDRRVALNDQTRWILQLEEQRDVAIKERDEWREAAEKANQ